MFIRNIASLLIAIIFISNACLAKEKLIPIEYFARKPAMSHVRLSPNGDRLAFLVNKEESTFLVTYDLNDKKQNIITSVDNQGKSFSWIGWPKPSNDKLLVSIVHEEITRSVKHYKTTLLIADWNSGEMALAAKPRENLHVTFSAGGKHDKDNELRPPFLDDVVSYLPHDRDHILLSADFEIYGRPGLYKIDLNSQFRSKVVDPVADVRHWVSDVNGEWLAGVGFDDGVRTIYVRKIDDINSKRKLWTYDVTKESGPYPLGFNSNPNRLIVRAPYNDHLAIFSVDYLSENPKMELLASDNAYDISGRLIWSPKSENFVGAYYEGSEGQYIYWDAEFKALQRGIDAALPSGRNYILAFSNDESRYVVTHSESDLPPIFLLGDRKRKSLNPIGYAYPELQNLTLPQRKPITIKSRDGLTLEGYITLPIGKKSNLPAVVLPHGGPSGRNYAVFDPWAAFIASRGYAVLQVNFRGSSGYGESFARSQMQKWGLELQDDLTDATKWMISEKIADPNRICIVGHSYGGYAALMGAIKTPDLYRCAVSSAGVTDLLGLIAHDSRFLEDEILNWQFGSRFFDRARLKKTSPVNNADKIKIPILLIHGDEDRVVPVKQSKDMYSALKSKHKKVKLIIQEGGNHRYSQYTHLLEFLTELEIFLEKNLKQ